MSAVLAFQWDTGAPVLASQYDGDPQPPQSAPTITNVDAGETSASVSYTGVSDATGYEYRLDGGAWNDVGTSNPFTILGLTADTPYNSPGVEVRGYNSVDAGPISDPAAFQTSAEDTELQAPDNVSMSASSTSVTLSWAAVDGATGYEVEHGPGVQGEPGHGGPYTVDDVGDTTSYTISNLGPGTYDARVRAY